MTSRRAQRHATRLQLLAWLALIMAIPRAARAQSANYQNRLVGQRALGLGGAFTAIADDPTAAYYNPAALTNLSRLQLEFGLPILGFNVERVFGGLVPAPAPQNDVLTTQVLALPTTVGAAAGIGPKDSTGTEMFTLGASLLIPWQRSLSQRQAVQTSATNAMHIVQENEQTLLIGGSLGFRLLPWLSFGISLYYMHQNITWLNARSGTTNRCNSDGSCRLDTNYNLTSLMEGWFGGINPRIGVLLKPSPRWSLGMMASLSTFRLWGAGGIKTSLVDIESDGSATQSTFDSDALQLWRPLPWELRIGTGIHPSRDLTISIDTSFYAPQRFGFVTGVPAALSIYPNEIERRFIFNVNLGLELYVRPTVPLRFGVFTNLSAAPHVELDPNQPGRSQIVATRDCDVRGCIPWMNGGGVTASVGFQIWRVSLDLGVNATYARGFTQQVEDTGGANRFRWSDTDQLALQFFLGGNLGKVINETAVEIRDRLQLDEQTKRGAAAH